MKTHITQNSMVRFVVKLINNELVPNTPDWRDDVKYCILYSEVKVKQHQQPPQPIEIEFGENDRSVFQHNCKALSSVSIGVIGLIDLYNGSLFSSIGN